MNLHDVTSMLESRFGGAIKVRVIEKMEALRAPRGTPKHRFQFRQRLGWGNMYCT